MIMEKEMFDNQYLYKTFIQTGLNSTCSFEEINE